MALLFIIFSVPISILSFITLTGKLFVDRHKIKKKAIPLITKNFVILNFLTQNKRIMKRIVRINSDGFSADIADRTYIIDKETIWFDEKNYANSFHFPEIPNSIDLDSESVINEFLKVMRTQNPEKSLGKDSQVVDLSFSSKNLQLFKKNKIFDELNKNPNADKMQMVLIGVIVFMLVILLVSIIL